MESYFANRFRIAGLIAIGIAAAAHASVTIDVDRYGPGDGLHMPPDGVVVVDVLVDVTDGDSWTAGGLAAQTFGGAFFLYARDPNFGWTLLTNPGAENRFVTFFSEPRPRDANARFTHGGAAAAGRFCGGGPTAEAFRTRVNVAYFSSPPETIGSPTVDGAVFRVAIDVSRVCNGETARVFRAGEAPPDYFPIFITSGCGYVNEPGMVAATFNVPTITGFSWGLYVPHDFEPCIGDLNCDGRVSLPDLVLLLSAFGECATPWIPLSIPNADFDGDGCVDLQDLLTVLSLFDTNCP